MRRFIRFVIAVIVTANIAASAWSQPGQPGRPGTAGGAGTAGSAGAAGRPGTSGPAGIPGTAGRAGTAGTAGTIGPIGTTNAGSGSGAAATAGRANVRANPPGRQAGLSGNASVSSTPLLADPGVRQQLNINNYQYGRLNSAFQDAYGRYNGSVSGLANNLPALQREQLMQQYASQFYDDIHTAVDATITDPQQRARYNQLALQYVGFRAFSDPVVQRAFDLLPQQLVQIKQLEAVWQQKLKQLERENGTDATISKMTPLQWSQMYAEHWDRLNAVLTPEQQQLWLQLTGQRYNFSPNVHVPGSNVSGTTGDNSNGGTSLDQSGGGATNGTGPPQIPQK